MVAQTAGAGEQEQGQVLTDATSLTSLETLAGPAMLALRSTAPLPNTDGPTILGLVSAGDQTLLYCTALYCTVLDWTVVYWSGL